LNAEEISPIVPKRGRKPTKVATPTEQSPEKPITATDRPVKIALSSHLVRNQFNFLHFSLLFVFIEFRSKSFRHIT
jgi:hypothetical protein